MSAFDEPLNGVNWPLLYEQRMALIRSIGLLTKMGGTQAEDASKLDGILSLLDSLQDRAAEAGLFVYPEEPESVEPPKDKVVGQRALVLTEVLSVDILPDPIELDALHYEITHGDWSGKVDVLVQEPCDAKTLSEYALNQGTDPEFLLGEPDEPEDDECTDQDGPSASS